MRALPWRLLGKPDGRRVGAEGGAGNGPRLLSAPDEARERAGLDAPRSADGDRVTGAGRAALTARIVAVEPLVAPTCALVLLLAPNPLVWPAVVVGALPLVARLLATGRPWRATPFDLPLLLVALGALLGGYASLGREGAAVRLAGLLAACLLFAALREHAGDERSRRLLVVGSLVGTLLATLLLLVLVGPFLLLERVPPLAALVAAVDRWQLGAWVVDQDWLLQRYRFRASGVGALAVVGLALVAAALAGLRQPRTRLLAALAAPVFLLALVVADNRGSMLAAALTLGLMATVWRRRLIALLPLVAALALLAIAFGPSDRGLSARTLAQRFWFWENSLYLARELPLTGAGLGLESVQLVYRAYFMPAYPPFSHAHNVYLQGLLEYGVIGLAGLLGLGLATLWTGWRAPAAGDRWTTAARLAGFGAALALLTTGLTEIVLLSTVGGVLALAALGLLATTSSTAPRDSAVPGQANGGGQRSEPPERGGARRRLALAAVLCLVAAAGLALSGLGGALGARLLLNAGTAELNRGTLSESIGRRERESAVERATNLLRLASTLRPDDVTIQRNLALALAAGDDMRGARAAANRAKELTAPDNRADLLQLGRAYAALSAWGETIRAWQAAEAAPQLIQLGNRLIRLRNFDQAVNAFIATARVDPRSRGAYEGVARAAREDRATPDETVERLGPLLERGAPTELGARLQAARVLREAGRLHAAALHLRRAEEIEAPPELSFEYGLLWLAAGWPASAELLLARTAADLPYDPDHWFWLARVRAELGQHEEAVAAIRQGLSKVDPSGQFAPPSERLPETAAVRATEIKRSERAPLLGAMAESLVRLGRADEALVVLDEAIAAAPRDRWLQRIQAEARAVHQGAPPNLLLNPAFDRSGSWGLRDRLLPAPTTFDDLLDETPAFEDGQVRIALGVAESRYLFQDVFGLDPTRRYRLTLRLRAEGLGSGGVGVYLLSEPRGDEVQRVLRPSEAEAWTTVTLEASPGQAPDDQLTVVVGFTPGTAPGAVFWCDEAALVDAGPAS